MNLPKIGWWLLVVSVCANVWLSGLAGYHSAKIHDRDRALAELGERFENANIRAAACKEVEVSRIKHGQVKVVRLQGDLLVTFLGMKEGAVK